VVVSSNANRRGVIDFDKMKCREDKGAFSDYASSKLANIMFTRELARRLEGTGWFYLRLISFLLPRNTTLQINWF
jgi:NAD(P)-dependent dehydrogenase (short-subunit alcohol dehydrogenase family)